ncbi:MAG: NOB1 family endonuclease [Candidatus Heimdallarchaeaceae archaeon]
MSKNEQKKRTYIIDSTAIMHFFPNDKIVNEDSYLVIPDILKSEIKSFQAKAVLEVMDADQRLVYASPSDHSLIKAKEKAESSGDISSLSETDIHVVAIALDFPESHVISDDNAVQNLCSFLGIQVETFSFKIKTRRVYFWKCIGCSSKFKEKLDVCPECGNKLRRFYKKKKIKW